MITKFKAIGTFTNFDPDYDIYMVEKETNDRMGEEFELVDVKVLETVGNVSEVEFSFKRNGDYRNY